METHVEPPVVLGMTISDALYQCAFTGKWTILGTFSFIESESFPFVANDFCALAVMTGFRGKTPLLFKLVMLRGLDDELPIAADFRTEIDISDPLETVEYPLPVRAIQFNEGGTYELQVWWEATGRLESIGGRRFRVVDKRTQA